MARVWRPSIRRLVLAVAAGMMVTAPAALAQEEAPVPLGLSETWEAFAYDFSDGSRRCVARAIYDGFLDGDVLWIFNSETRESEPFGYLALDYRLMEGANGAAVAVERDGRYAVTAASDGFGYGDPAEAGRLFDAMRRYNRMTLTVNRPPSEARAFAISLRGFTRATGWAAEACGFDPAVER